MMTIINILLYFQSFIIGQIFKNVVAIILYKQKIILDWLSRTVIDNDSNVLFLFKSKSSH